MRTLLGSVALPCSVAVSVFFPKYKQNYIALQIQTFLESKKE
jgi:hypothetical protein